MKRKLLAALLTLVMVVGVIPVGVMAEVVNTSEEVMAGESEAPVEVSTYDELLDALDKENAYIIFMNDITANIATESNGYGKTGIIVEVGQVVDGNNYTLTVNKANGTWDSVIHMKGGTVKNLTIAGAFRGVSGSNAKGDVVIDNCEFKNVTYTFHTDAGSATYSATIKNSIVNGWTSYGTTGFKTVTFESCTFGEGNGYAYCRPYSATTFINCMFEEGYEIDFDRTINTFVNTVTFDANGGNCEVSSVNVTKVVEKGGDTVLGVYTMTSIPSATKEGYVLDGWYTADGIKVNTNTALGVGTVLTAKWTEKVVTDAGDVSVVQGDNKAEIAEDFADNFSVPENSGIASATISAELQESVKEIKAELPVQESEESYGNLIDNAVDENGNKSVIDKNTAAEKYNEAFSGTATPEEVEIVIVPKLDSTVNGFTLTEEEDETKMVIDFEIEATYDVVATKDTQNIILEGENKNSVALSSGNKLEVTEAIEIKIPLPATIYSIINEKEITTMYMKHTKDDGRVFIYEAPISEENGVKYITFTNPNGFSSFDASTYDTSIVKIDGIGYETLQEAVNVLPNNGTITLSADCDDTAVIDRPITFTLVEGNYRFTGSIKAAPGLHLVERDGVFTVTNLSKLPRFFGIKLIAGDGGSVQAVGGGKSTDLIIAFGAGRTINITPDEGYRIKDVLVNDISVGAVEKYAIKVAAQSYTIEAVFEEIPAEEPAAESVEASAGEAAETPAEA